LTFASSVIDICLNAPEINKTAFNEESGAFMTILKDMLKYVEALFIYLMASILR
jgi:hypothetical protein